MNINHVWPWISLNYTFLTFNAININLIWVWISNINPIQPISTIIDTIYIQSHNRTHFTLNLINLRQTLPWTPSPKFRPRFHSSAPSRPRVSRAARWPRTGRLGRQKTERGALPCGRGRGRFQISAATGQNKIPGCPEKRSRIAKEYRLKQTLQCLLILISVVYLTL